MESTSFSNFSFLSSFLCWSSCSETLVTFKGFLYAFCFTVVGSDKSAMLLGNSSLAFFEVTGLDKILNEDDFLLPVVSSTSDASPSEMDDSTSSSSVCTVSNNRFGYMGLRFSKTSLLWNGDRLSKVCSFFLLAANRLIVALKINMKI